MPNSSPKRRSSSSPKRKSSSHRKSDDILKDYTIAELQSLVRYYGGNPEGLNTRRKVIDAVVDIYTDVVRQRLEYNDPRLQQISLQPGDTVQLIRVPQNIQGLYENQEAIVKNIAGRAVIVEIRNLNGSVNDFKTTRDHLRFLRRGPSIQQQQQAALQTQAVIGATSMPTANLRSFTQLVECLNKGMSVESIDFDTMLAGLEEDCREKITKTCSLKFDDSSLTKEDTDKYAENLSKMMTGQCREQHLKDNPNDLNGANNLIGIAGPKDSVCCLNMGIQMNEEQQLLIVLMFLAKRSGALDAVSAEEVKKLTDKEEDAEKNKGIFVKIYEGIVNGIKSFFSFITNPKVLAGIIGAVAIVGLGMWWMGFTMSGTLSYFGLASVAAQATDAAAKGWEATSTTATQYSESFTAMISRYWNGVPAVPAVPGTTTNVMGGTVPGMFGGTTYPGVPITVGGAAAQPAISGMQALQGDVSAMFQLSTIINILMGAKEFVFNPTHIATLGSMSTSTLAVAAAGGAISAISIGAALYNTFSGAGKYDVGLVLAVLHPREAVAVMNEMTGIKAGGEGWGKAARNVTRILSFGYRGTSYWESPPECYFRVYQEIKKSLWRTRENTDKFLAAFLKRQKLRLCQVFIEAGVFATRPDFTQAVQTDAAQVQMDSA